MAVQYGLLCLAGLLSLIFLLRYQPGFYFAIQVCILFLRMSLFQNSMQGCLGFFPHLITVLELSCSLVYGLVDQIFNSCFGALERWRFIALSWCWAVFCVFVWNPIACDRLSWLPTLYSILTLYQLSCFGLGHSNLSLYVINVFLVKYFSTIFMWIGCSLCVITWSIFCLLSFLYDFIYHLCLWVLFIYLNLSQFYNKQYNNSIRWFIHFVLC